MSRIDERLEIMGVDTSEMTTEEKFTAATGLTRYDEEMAANDWYVPAGAANTPDEAKESEETAPVEPTGEHTGSSEPTSEVEPTGTEPTGTEPTSEVEPTGEEPTGTEPTGETGNPSTVDVETDPTGEPTGEPTGTEPTGEETGSNPVLDNQKYWYIGLNEPTSETIINEDLAQNELSLGWHNIPGELTDYSKSNPIFAGNAEHTILIDENYKDVDYCVVLPVGVGIHGAMADPNPGDFTLVGTLELNNVQYNVYNSNGSDFGWMLY